MTAHLRPDSAMPVPATPQPLPPPIEVVVPLSYEDFEALDRYAGASRPARNPREHADFLLLAAFAVFQVGVLRYVRGETAGLEIQRPVPYVLLPGRLSTDIEVLLRHEDCKMVRMLAGGDDRNAWAAILGGLIRDAVAPFRAESLANLAPVGAQP